MKIYEILTEDNADDNNVIQFPLKQVRSKIAAGRQAEFDGDISKILTDCQSRIYGFSFKPKGTIGGFDNIETLLSELTKNNMPITGVYGRPWNTWFDDLKENNPSIANRIKTFANPEKLGELSTILAGCIEKLIQFLRTIDKNQISDSDVRLIETKVLDFRYWWGTLVALKKTLIRDAEIT